MNIRILVDIKWETIWPGSDNTKDYSTTTTTTKQKKQQQQQQQQQKHHHQQQHQQQQHQFQWQAHAGGYKLS